DSLTCIVTAGWLRTNSPPARVRLRCLATAHSSLSWCNVIAKQMLQLKIIYLTYALEPPKVSSSCKGSPAWPSKGGHPQRGAPTCRSDVLKEESYDLSSVPAARNRVRVLSLRLK